MTVLYSYDANVSEFEKRILENFKQGIIHYLEADPEKSIAYEDAGKFIIEAKDDKENLIRKVKIIPLLRHLNKVHGLEEVGEGDEAEVKKVIYFDKIYNIEDYDKVIAGNEADFNDALQNIFPEVEGKVAVGFSNYYKSISVRIYTVSPIEITEETGE